VSANQAATASAVGSAAIGTALGAAAGAAFNGGAGAAVGAGAGLLVGSAFGVGAAQDSAYGVQRLRSFVPPMHVCVRRPRSGPRPHDGRAGHTALYATAPRLAATAAPGELRLRLALA
jgi:hypothetical protein